MSAGGEGKLPGRGTFPLWGPRLSLSSPRFLHTSYAPQISWVSSPSYLCPQCIWGIPLFPPTPPPTFIFGTRMLSGSLVTTAGAPKPSLSPKGLLAVPVPRSPPLASPAGTSAAWLVAEIGHHPQPRASPFCPQCRQAGSLPSLRAGLAGLLSLLSSGTPTHSPWERCRGWQGHPDCFYFLLCCRQAGQQRDPCGELLTPHSEEQGWQQGTGVLEQSPFPVCLVFGHTWARHGWKMEIP